MSFDNVPITRGQSERLFPEAYHEKPTAHFRLSIIDANVVNWGDSAATWYLDAPCSSLTAAHFRTSLRMTLAAYPQWCGRVILTSPSNATGHLNRFGRLHVRYHDVSDPGVGFAVAKCATTLAALIPSAEERANNYNMWKRDRAASTLFLPSDPLMSPVHDPLDSRNSGMLVQITQFDCGSLAITIRMTHSLADAHALAHFANDWAAVSRAILHSTPVPTLSALFNGLLVDEAAAADLDSTEPDSKILAAFQALPCRGYDQWASRAGAPWSVYIPETFLSTTAPETPSGLLMPWSTWDVSAPCSHVVLHFSPAQTQRIYAMASTGGSGVSRQDAILAHVWACIARARRDPISLAAAEQNGRDDPFYCYLTIGCRPKQRLDLGDSFIGSPILHTAVSLPGSVLGASDAISAATATAAASMRSAVTRFDATAIGLFLYRVAFELSPQRIWHAFLGSRHTIITSWVRSGIYDVDFSGTEEGRVRYAEGVMPLMDGIMQIMEAAPIRNVTKSTEAAQWWRNGIDVSLSLESEAMARVFQDTDMLPPL